MQSRKELFGDDQPQTSSKHVPDLLRQAAATYEQRNKVYGDSWLVHGQIMAALFSNGVTLNNADDFNRYAKIDNVVMKLSRYCQAFNKGGHQDSAHDAIVYAAMLESLTDD